MKKTPALLLAAALVLSLCACGNGGPTTPPVQETPEAAPASSSDLSTPAPEEDVTDELLLSVRRWIRETDCVFGLAFIGYVDPNMSIAESIETCGVLEEREYSTHYPFMNGMEAEQYCSNGGSELYCLVPAGAGTGIRIEEAEMEDGEPTDRLTEVFRTETGKPLFFTLNSNGWGGSDVILTVRNADGKELRCNPGLYCNLGTLAIPDEVMDLTIYPEGSSAHLLRQMRGDWFGKEILDGTQYDFWLTLLENGDAFLDITEDGTADAIWSYDGWWSAGLETVYLDLLLLDGTQYDENAEPERFCSEYFVEGEDGWDQITLREGEPFLPGGENTVSFVRCCG